MARKLQSISGAAPDATDTKAEHGAATADKIAELTAALQRVQADYANYRKRALRDQEATAERAKASVVTQLLGVLDDLDRARSHGDLESGPLKLVADKLLGALTGLQPATGIVQTQIYFDYYDLDGVSVELVSVQSKS